jgi:flagellar FliJ protein
MARFIFKLEGVLRQREHVEQQRQRELAQVQTQAAQLEGELRALSSALAATTQDVVRNRLVGRLDLPFLAAHRRYSAAMQRKGMALVQRLAVLQKQVDSARAALAEAAKQRKVIEKLRERQQERWAADQAQRETAQIDEISMQMSYRQWADGDDEIGEAIP